jgi:hypothetical protein
MKSLLRIVSLSGVALVSSTGCGESRTAEGPLRPVDVMKTIVTPSRFERLRMYCPYPGSLITAVVPQERMESARGCREEAADTSFYLYLDGSGAPLVAGREFSIYPEQVGPAFVVSRDRLRRLTDSVRATVASRFGPGAPCPINSQYGPYDGWIHRWDGTDFGIMVIGSYREVIGTVMLEVHAGEPNCVRMAGAPAHR